MSKFFIKKIQISSFQSLAIVFPILGAFLSSLQFKKYEKIY
jgi:hypothetical protein